MRTALYGGVGTLLVLASMAVLAAAGIALSKPDYVAAILLTLTGLSLLKAGVELVRPWSGE